MYVHVCLFVVCTYMSGLVIVFPFWVLITLHIASKNSPPICDWCLCVCVYVCVASDEFCVIINSVCIVTCKCMCAHVHVHVHVHVYRQCGGCLGLGIVHYSTRISWECGIGSGCYEGLLQCVCT